MTAIATSNAVEDTDDSYSDDENADYLRWKENIPYMYDSFINHNLEWPCSALAWGPIQKDCKRVTHQTIYLSQHTDAELDRFSQIWQGSPNTIEVCTVKLFHPNTELYSQLKNFSEEEQSKRIQVEKRILHPGEVTRIKSFDRNPSILASHTNSNDVFIWNTIQQISKTKKSDQRANKPDAVLKGHTDEAGYALDVATYSPKVCSGGNDKKLILWDIEAKAKRDTQDNNCIEPISVLEGHTDQVLEVVFHPQNDCLIASSSADKSILLWDIRSGNRPVMTIDKIHKDDINTISWNYCHENMLCSGSSDKSVKVTDIRKAEDSVSTVFESKMDDNITCVNWNSFATDCFVSGDESGMVKLFNTQNNQDGHFLYHAGHRAPIESAEWNPYYNNINHLEWVIATSSNDGAVGLGGGTLQIWRPLDLLYKKDEDCIFEMQKIFN